VNAFNAAVPDLVHIRNIYEHFDAYAEGPGRRQRDKTMGPGDWRPLHSKVGDAYYVVRFGPFRPEIGLARKASSHLLVAALDTAS
jgi:hypothetical protein